MRPKKMYESFVGGGKPQGSRSSEIMGNFQANVPGIYYVKERCIGCCICSEIAPQNFRSNLAYGFDFVYKQPQDPEEHRMCVEAMDICPVNAICNDGGKTP